jgi:hypothetical protein
MGKRGLRHFDNSTQQLGRRERSGEEQGKECTE